MPSSPQWTLSKLYNTLISNKNIVMYMNEIDHGIQFVLYNDLKINWYYKNGSTVVQGKKSLHRDRLCKLINSDNGANSISTEPEATPSKYQYHPKSIY